MKKDRHSSKYVRSLTVLILFIVASIAISGCGAVHPVYLKTQDVTAGPQENKNLEVAVVVEDTRPAPIRAVRMIGPVRGGYNNIAGFAFLSNLETFDIILARHLKDRLENAGFRVVSTYPEIPNELSGESQQLDKNAFSSSDKKAARAMEDTVIQSDSPKSEVDAKIQYEKIKAQDNAADLKLLPKWDDSIEVPNADAVVYARVGALYADHFMIWPSAKLETYLGTITSNISVWGKKGAEYTPRLNRSLNGAAFTVDPWPFPRIRTAHSIMINESFEKMVDQFEELAYSTELVEAVKGN